MSMNSAEAVPILKDVLKQRDACRIELRKKAVWMISQNARPTSSQTLLDVARNDPSTDVQADAVFWLVANAVRAGHPGARFDSLLVRATMRCARRRSSRCRSSMTNARARRCAARRRTNVARRKFGARRCSGSATRRPPISTTSRRCSRRPRARSCARRSCRPCRTRHSPEAMTWLLDIAQGQELRHGDAQERDLLGRRSGGRSTSISSPIYEQAKGDDEIQKQVLFVYSQRREPAAVDKLMAVAKSDPNIEMRKQALFWLGQKNDPRVQAVHPRPDHK